MAKQLKQDQHLILRNRVLGEHRRTSMVVRESSIRASSTRSRMQESVTVAKAVISDYNTAKTNLDESVIEHIEKELYNEMVEE